jgi:hypothetical protein
MENINKKLASLIVENLKTQQFILEKSVGEVNESILETLEEFNK